MCSFSQNQSVCVLHKVSMCSASWHHNSTPPPRQKHTHTHTQRSLMCASGLAYYNSATPPSLALTGHPCAAACSPAGLTRPCRAHLVECCWPRRLPGNWLGVMCGLTASPRATPGTSTQAAAAAVQALQWQWRQVGQGRGKGKQSTQGACGWMLLGLCTSPHTK